MKRLTLWGIGLGMLVCQLTGILPGPVASAATLNIIPAAISNQYSGYITLQISNLTAGAAVVVQKFADVNSNGIVDAGDFLAQQFQLTDGQGPAVFSGVTNVNIPFDSNPTSGAITVQLSPATEGIVQRFVGQYLFVVSSPTGSFTPVTNAFSVTNSGYGQKFTGQVTSSGSNVPNALVFLAGPPSSDGFNLLGGTITDGAGNYKIKAAPGTYQLIAFKNNFVVNAGTAPVLTLGSGVTITTNLVLSNATRTVSGSFVDATNAGVGIPGALMAAESTNGIAGFGGSDTNGNFSLPALAGPGQIGMDAQSLDLLGYVGLHKGTNIDTTGGNVSGVTLAFPKATAIIYGSVTDTNGNPVPGVRLSGDFGTNGNGTYKGDGTTDPNGNYAIGVIAGLWSPSLENSDNSLIFPNYVFSQGPSWLSNNGGSGTNVTNGAAIQANFSAVLATNLITGYVKDNNSNAIVGVQVFAYTTIAGANYQTEQNTDANGNYSLNVSSGSTWNVNVLCCCDNNSLQNLGNYQCPNGTNVSIANNNGVANFIVQTNGGASSYQITGYVTNVVGNPITGLNVYATNNQGANLSVFTDGTGYYSFTVSNANWDVSLNCGALNSQGYACPGDQMVNISGSSGMANFLVQSNVASYQISGYVTNTSGNPISGVNVYATNNGQGSNLSTSTAGNGHYSFSVSNGSWGVTVDCGQLGTLGYACPAGQMVNISGSSGVANFTVQAVGGAVTNVWTYKPFMPTPRSGVAAASYNGMLYAVGGAGSQSPGIDGTLEVYNPATGVWSSRAPMNTGRENLAAAFLNGHLYAAGGFGSNGSAAMTLEVYDPATNQWTTLASMSEGRSAFGVGVISNQLYAVGGNNPYHTLEVYDPVANSWSFRSPLPTFRTPPAVAVVSNKLYALGGDNNNTVEVYDPAADLWSSRASISTGSQDMLNFAATVLNGKIYVLGGYNSGATTMQVYDPGSNTWSALPSLPSFRASLGAATIGSDLYAVGGTQQPGDVPLPFLEQYGPPTNDPLVTLVLVSDGSVGACSLGHGVPPQATFNRLNSGNTSGLSFTSDLLGAYGSSLSLPEGSPTNTQIINLPPGNAQSGFFQTSFVLPAVYSGLQLSFSANLDADGRAFLNGTPFTPSIPQTGQLSGINNSFYSVTTNSLFHSGTNLLLLANISFGETEAAAFYAFVTYTTNNVSPPAPTISQASLHSPGHFQMSINGVAGQNYTIQYSPSIHPASWQTLLVTNAPSSSFTVTDPGAGGSARFYRILVGP